MTPRDAFLARWDYLFHGDYDRVRTIEFTESVDALLAESNKELLAEVERLEEELGIHENAASEWERLKAKLWQPIETAPKDGTWILVWGDGYDRPKIAQWTNGPHVWWGGSQYGFLFNDFTHWMPCPGGPE